MPYDVNHVFLGGSTMSGKSGRRKTSEKLAKTKLSLCFGSLKTQLLPAGFGVDVFLIHKRRVWFIGV